MITELKFDYKDLNKRCDILKTNVVKYLHSFRDLVAMNIHIKCMIKY